ncbi:O-antigen ligase family protein, partial [Peribacillus butanolivorans]
VTLLINIIIAGKKGLKIIILILIIISSFILFSPDYQRDRLLNLFSSEDEIAQGSSLSLRKGLLNLSVELVSEKPFLGWGTGSFSTLSKENGYGGLTSHNDFALVAVENGIIGLILFILFIGTLIFLSIKYLKFYYNDWEKKGLLNSILAITLYLFFINAVDSIFLWLNIGLLFALITLRKRQIG